MNSVAQDLRYAGRLARRRSLFAVSAVTTLTLGIAGAAASFAIFDRILLQPLPYPDPGRIVSLIQAVRPHFGGGVRFSKEVMALPQFAALGMYQAGRVNLGSAERPLRLAAAGVDAGFFHTLGVPPLRGRYLSSDDQRQRVAVVAFGAWRSEFNGDPDLVGRDIQLNGRAFRVVGIMPRGFTFPNNTSFWMPPNVDAQMTGVAYTPSVIGRLASGVSASQAIVALAEAEGLRRPGAGTAIPLQDELSRGPKPILIVLVGLSTLLLLSASANVAGLLAVRQRARLREFVTRAMLGATRGRLVRQALTEALALGAVSSMLGSVLMLWIVRLVASSVATFVPNVNLSAFDGRFLGATVLASTASAAVFAVAPVWSSPRLATSRSGVARSGSFAGTLVVSQVALALVLLVATTAAALTLMRLVRVDLGFHDAKTVIFKVTPPATTYGGTIRPDPERVNALVGQLETRLRTDPIVSHVGATTAEPGSSDVLLDVRLPTGTRATGIESPQPWAVRLAATPDYFRAMGIPLIAGRWFTAADKPPAPGVVIISQSAVPHLAFDAKHAIGRTVDMGSSGHPMMWPIVGVVGDVRLDGPKAAVSPQVYEPLAQSSWITGLAIAVESEGSPAAVIDVTRRALRDLDPDLPIDRIVREADLSASFLPAERLTAVVASSFATMSLILSAVGLFSFLTQLVNDRTKEIGIRMALGAQHTRVTGSILANGVRLALLGAILGAVASTALFRLIAASVPDLSAPRPLPVVVCGIALLLVAGLASWIPAHRASAINPALTLHSD